MKSENKRGLIIVSALVVIIAVIGTAFIPRLFSSSSNRSLHKYFEKDIKNVDNIEFISPVQTVEKKDDTIAGVKECVRLGADCVTVNLCFRKDSTPVMCSDYKDAENAETIENLFKAMNDDKYKDTKIYLKIVQLSDMTILNQLCVDYDMLERIYLIGIDEDHYGMVTSDDTIIPIFLDYEIKSDDIKSAEDGEFTVIQTLNKYGAVGIIIDSECVDEETTEILNIYSIPFIVDNIGSEGKLCKAILNGAVNIMTDTPERSKEILNLWTIEMQERYQSSVEKSLQELSTKAGE